MGKSEYNAKNESMPFKKKYSKEDTELVKKNIENFFIEVVNKYPLLKKSGNYNLNIGLIIIIIIIMGLVIWALVD